MANNSSYENEIVKRKFFTYLKDAQGFSDISVQCIEKALWLWDEFTGNADYGSFGEKQAVGFKEWLKNKKKNRSETLVSLSYCYDNFRYLRTFFSWLAEQPGYKSKISPVDIHYLNLSKKEARMAIMPKPKKLPSLEDVKKVIETIQPKNEIDRRDRALLSLTLLTGARISALGSLPLESFDEKRMTIDQNPKLNVRTKFSKRIVTALMPFPYKEACDYFVDWARYLRDVKGFGPSDPLFPATKVENGRESLGYYSNGEVEPVFWKSGSSLRKIFEKRFDNAGLPYYHPHTFRHLLVKEISKLPLTEEQKKAISQNLGHEHVGTTFGTYGYGAIGEDRQIELIRTMSLEKTDAGANLSVSNEQIGAIVAEVLKKLPAHSS